MVAPPPLRVVDRLAWSARTLRTVQGAHQVSELVELRQRHSAGSPMMASIIISQPAEFCNRACAAERSRGWRRPPRFRRPCDNAASIHPNRGGVVNLLLLPRLLHTKRCELRPLGDPSQQLTASSFATN